YDPQSKRVLEKVRRSPGVRLIITTDDHKFVLTKELRKEVGGYDIRLPGGKVFDTLDEYRAACNARENLLEKAEAAARKEAREEVGIEIEKLRYLTTSTCGATVEWDLYYFQVEKFVELEGQNLELGEDINVIKVHRDEVLQMCLDGRIGEDRSVAVLLRYFLIII
ncbi:MAG: NUDIX domain-containing protein, partial [Patescibacteria group bacterium]